MKLKNDLSAYLDFMRFMAALAVLLGHLEQLGFSTAWLGLTQFSHEAVIVFFVLSGLIIHHSTITKQSSVKTFTIARLSRIYSVALPAIIACSAISILIDHSPSLTPDRAFSWIDLLSSLLFLNESWTNPAALSMNPPFWSLCYEVWFYILFGLFVFVNGAWRWPLISVAALIAGPAIILLLPIWLTGAWVSAHARGNETSNTACAWIIFLTPIVLIILINSAGIDLQVRAWLKEIIPPMWRLESAQRFATDYLIGILIAFNIQAFAALPKKFRGWFVKYKTQLATLAGFSFTLYLFHWPMLIIIQAYAPATSGEVFYPIFVGLCVLVTCWFISFGTEKQLHKWRYFISNLIMAIKRPES